MDIVGALYGPQDRTRLSMGPGILASCTIIPSALVDRGVSSSKENLPDRPHHAKIDSTHNFPTCHSPLGNSQVRFHVERRRLSTRRSVMKKLTSE